MRSIKRASSKKRMLILSLLILLLCMSIGYAYLSSSLKLDIVANVDKLTWDIHLENVVVRSGSVSAIPPVISSDKTSVSLTVTFSQPNEYYEFYIDVVNKGTIDAQVESIYKTPLTIAQKKYLEYRNTYKDGAEIKQNDVLASGEKETLKVIVYIKDLHESLYPTISTNLTLEGRINYIQKNNDGIIRNKNSLYEQIVKETQSDLEINFGDFSSDTNGKGVYTLTRTATYAYPIYYYRGDVQNNNVLFANFCWKIIRTTTTGGMKLIYNGVPKKGVCNNTAGASQIGNSPFNVEQNDAKYVGYMYDDNTEDSAIKSYIDEWFLANLVDYQKYLEDTPFYNERDHIKATAPTIYFAPRIRIWGSGGTMGENVPNTSVKLGATNLEDVFTVSSDIGNGKLTYPVGLITSDEMILAGGRGEKSATDTGINPHYYLFTNLNCWTMSPHSLDFGSRSGMIVFGRQVTFYWNSNSIGVRPVVSLKSGISYLSGDGTSESPYVMTE